MGGGCSSEKGADKPTSMLSSRPGEKSSSRAASPLSSFSQSRQGCNNNGATGQQHDDEHQHQRGGANTVSSLVDTLEPLTDAELELIRQTWLSTVEMPTSATATSSSPSSSALRTVFEQAVISILDKTNPELTATTNVDDIVHTIGSGAYDLHEEVDEIVRDIDNMLIHSCCCANSSAGPNKSGESSLSLYESVLLRTALQKPEHEGMRLHAERSVVAPFHTLLEHTLRDIAEVEILKRRRIREEQEELERERQRRRQQQLRAEEEERQEQRRKQQRALLLSHQQQQQQQPDVVHHQNTSGSVRPAPPPPARTPLSSTHSGGAGTGAGGGQQTPRTPGGTRWPGKSVPAAPPSRGATPRGGAATPRSGAAAAAAAAVAAASSSREPFYEVFRKNYIPNAPISSPVHDDSNGAGGETEIAKNLLEVFVTLVEQTASEVTEQRLQSQGGRASSPEERRQVTLNALSGLTRQWSKSQQRADSQQAVAAAATTAAPPYLNKAGVAVAGWSEPSSRSSAHHQHQQQQQQQQVAPPIAATPHEQRAHPQRRSTVPTPTAEDQMKNSSSQPSAEQHQQQQNTTRNVAATTTSAADSINSNNASTTTTTGSFNKSAYMDPNISIKNINRAQLMSMIAGTASSSSVSSSSAFASVAGSSAGGSAAGSTTTSAIPASQQQTATTGNAEAAAAAAAPAPAQRRHHQHHQPKARPARLEVPASSHDHQDQHHASKSSSTSSCSSSSSSSSSSALPDAWIKIGNGCFRNPKTQRVFDPSRPSEYMDEVTGEWLSLAVG